MDPHSIEIVFVNKEYTIKNLRMPIVTMDFGSWTWDFFYGLGMTH